MAPPKLQPLNPNWNPKEDGSSVRIKVAQYTVKKKLKELKSKNPKLKIDDWTLLHTLPELAVEGAEDPESQVAEPAPLAGETPKLPPIFQTPPGGDSVSWEDLLEFDRKRRDSTPYDNKRGFPPPPSWAKVAIIGAGVAGLRTAMLLQKQGIPYEIFEASDRVGGRIFTYQFAPSPGYDKPGENHNYYDVGAMRYPDNDSSKITFDLFRELGVQDKLIPFVFSRENNIYEYNCEC